MLAQYVKNELTVSISFKDSVPNHNITYNLEHIQDDVITLIKSESLDLQLVNNTFVFKIINIDITIPYRLTIVETDYFPELIQQINPRIITF